MRTIDLGEYEAHTTKCFTPSMAIREKLARSLAGRIDLTWLAQDELKIVAKDYVGVVRVTNELSVRITPKYAGDELDVLTMLATANRLSHLSIEELERDLNTGPQGDLLELLCELVVQTSLSVFLAGPLQDYHADSDDLSLLRGRLDLVRQTTRHFGRVDVLACRFEEFDHDVLENVVLREALKVARTVSKNHPSRRLATALHEDFSVLAPGSFPGVGTARRQLTYNRRNQHYRAAHNWALSLLEGHLLDAPFDDRGERAPVFLISMNTLFEQFVACVFADCLAGSGIRVSAQAHSEAILWRGLTSWGPIRPDLLLRKGDQELAVDTKYKLYDTKRLAIEDLYQGFLYAQAFTSHSHPLKAVLVYPSLDVEPDLQIDLRPASTTLATVTAAGLPLHSLLRHLRIGGSMKADSLVALRERLLALIDFGSGPTH